MENCSNRGLRKWKQGIVISLMLLLSITFGGTISNATEQKATVENKAQQSVQVKLPEGLYLYQPMIIRMYKYDLDIKDDLFSPLFIVKKGKLHDPYLLAKKIGMKKFTKEYITGKTFNVFVGTEMVGKLSDVKLRDIYPCRTETFFFKILGSGRYEGSPLPGRYADKSVYALNDDEIFLNPATVKAIAIPQSFQLSKKMEAFTVTEEDKTKAVKKVRENLVSDAIKPIEEWLAKENRIIVGEKGSRLESVKAIDIDGNGKKDVLGTYGLYVGHRKKTDHSDSVGGVGNDIHFVLWDTGEVENIIFDTSLRQPNLSLGGLIDIDQDGVQELVVQVTVSRDVEYGDDGKRIEIFRHDSSGWKSIYRSERICSTIN